MIYKTLKLPPLPKLPPAPYKRDEPEDGELPEDERENLNKQISKGLNVISSGGFKKH